MAQLLVTKASGISQPFSEKKLRRSLKRIGATSTDIKEILEEITPNFYEGISTQDLYHMAFRALRKRSRPLAARYGLKNAVFQLGPGGFPFEKYIAALYRAQGYSVTTNQLLKGKCVVHEVDVVAVRDGRRLLMECKFHNQPGSRCDLKVALYVQARAMDLLDDAPQDFSLVTNTRFTKEAIQYGTCAGLTMIGWNYPENEGLLHMIQNKKLHPLTCLTTLSTHQKRELIRRGIILAKDLSRDLSKLGSMGLKDFQIIRIADELALL